MRPGTIVRECERTNEPTDGRTSGLDGQADERTDRQTDRQTDGRTDADADADAAAAAMHRDGRDTIEGNCRALRQQPTADSASSLAWSGHLVRGGATRIAFGAFVCSERVSRGGSRRIIEPPPLSGFSSGEK